MAGDPLKKVQAGQQLNIPAEAYNAFIDAARATRGQQALGAEADAFSRQTTLAKVRNLTGSNRQRFSIVGLSQPIVLPADNEAEFLRQTTFDGVMPASGYEDRFAVLMEPLATSRIGVAAVAGVVPARVHFTAYDQDHAAIINGDATKLKGATSGSARILWHEDFPESTEPPNVTLWALVRLGSTAGASEPPLRRFVLAETKLSTDATARCVFPQRCGRDCGPGRGRCHAP